MEAQKIDISELELKYHDITELYDLAEELVDTVESEFISNPDDQLALVEPLVEAIGNSADVLTEVFCDVAKTTDKAMNKKYKKKIELSLRKIHVAMTAYNKKSKKMASKAAQSVMNIANPIVEKIKRQVEVICAIFIDFVDISLDLIMQKSAIEEMRKRQEKIAIMLHNIEQTNEMQR